MAFQYCLALHLHKSKIGLCGHRCTTVSGDDIIQNVEGCGQVWIIVHENAASVCLSVSMGVDAQLLYSVNNKLLRYSSADLVDRISMPTYTQNDDEAVGLVG